MGFLSSCAKYIIFFFNLLIALFALALIVLSAITLRTASGIEGSSATLGWAIGICVFIFLIAFFGCCGAIKENSCMLITYAVIMVIFSILALIIAGLVFYAVSDKFFEKDTVTRKMRDELSKPSSNTTFFYLQSALECCGAYGPRDYADLHRTLPGSCCGFEDDRSCPDNQVFRTGCGQALTDFLKKFGKTIAGIFIGLGLFELIAAIFACVVRSNVRHHQYA